MAHWWQNYPWRIIQTNMREIDMVGLDADRFVSDLESFHANTVMISFGGTLANYDSEVEDHYINTNRSGDDLKTLVDKCHEKGIKVIARTDFSKMHESLYSKHPDWVYRDANGDILDNDGYLSTCQNSPFQKEFMDKVITEIIRKFKVDGIYCNMGGFMIVDYKVKLHGPCHCVNCQKAFREMSGMDLPEKDIPFASTSDPKVGLYQKFKSMVTASQKKRVEKLIHSIDPEVAFVSVDYVRQESNTEIGRALPHWQYSAASNTRAMKTCTGSADNASVDMIGFSSRGTSVSPALHEYRLWQALANFGGLDFFTMGRLDNREDKSGYDRARKVFDFAYRNEDLLRGSYSTSDVLLVRDSYQIPSPDERGWVRFLTELHILFDEVLTSSLDKVDVSKYKAVILPGKNRISPNVCSVLDDYVRNGGRVLATGKASDLKCLGLEVSQFVSAEGSSIMLSDSDREQLPSMVERCFIPLGKGYYQYSVGTAEGMAQIMPPQRFGPPEVCYVAESPTGYNGLLYNVFGDGLAVYLPWDLGAMYYSEGYDIWLMFAKDVLETVMGLESVGPDLSPMVEVTVGRSGDRTMVQFVNGTGHFGTSFFDPVVVSDVKVSIPFDGELPKAKSLHVKDNCCVRKVGGKLEITVRKLGFYENIVLENK